MRRVDNILYPFAPEDGAGSPGSPIGSLVERLRTTFPGAEICSGDRGVTVRADETTGYTVSLELIDNSAIVSLGPGLMEFDDIDVAVEHVIMACAEDSRLQVIKNGTQIKSWHFEHKQSGGAWQRLFTGGYSMFGNLLSGRNDETVTYCNRRTPFRAVGSGTKLQGRSETDPAA